MSIIVTKEDFLKRAKEKHGDKYSYDKMEYRVMSEKILITCPEHGDFWQLPESHVSGTECRKCANKGISKRCTKTQKQFILDAIKTHENTYTYNKVKYTGDKNKVTITCKIHGDFEQFPGNHIKGHGCSKCNFDSVKMKTEEFVKRASTLHGNYYDYSKITDNFLGNNTKLPIICPLHGLFFQLQRSHLQGHECKKCAQIKIGNKTRHTTEDFIKSAINIHGNIYNYSKVDYKGAEVKVIIICKEHGEFLQEPRTHLSECGCPTCNKYQGYSRSQWVNYNIGKTGTLYIIRCWNEKESFYKIGITGNSLKERYPIGGDLKYKWNIINELKSTNLEYLWDLEKIIKNELQNYKYKPQIKFAGSSVECFSLIKFNYICNLK